MLIQFTIFVMTALSQSFLRKIHKDLDKLIVRKGIFSTLSMVYEVTEHSPITSTTTPIIISNHVNWFDIYYHCVRMFPISFVSKAEISNAFIIGKVAAKMQSVYLERESESSRASTLEKIENQINSYNRDSYNFNPMIIFP
jgi:1-acyl-sn-glycerol-3-phosphate acyltransferase